MLSTGGVGYVSVAPTRQVYASEAPSGSRRTHGKYARQDTLHVLEQEAIAWWVATPSDFELTPEWPPPCPVDISAWVISTYWGKQCHVYRICAL